MHIESILEASPRQAVRWNRRADLLSFKYRLQRCVRSQNIPYKFGGTVDPVLAPDGVRCRRADWLGNDREPVAPIALVPLRARGA